jgi:hypothetical protein
LDEEKNAYIDLFGTLMARTEGGGFEGTVLQPSLYESHPNDSRVTGPVEQCPTVSAQWGTGGNNTPLVTDGATAYSIAPGRQGTAEKVDDIHVTEQDTSRTLDCTGACQERRQGGTLIVQPSFAYDDRSQAVSMDTHHTPLVTDNSLGFQSKASFCTGIESGISVPITTESIPAVVYPDAVVQPGEALPLAYDDRNQAVSTDTHHTPLVTDGGTHFRKSKRAQSVNDDETWVESDVTNTMNVFDQGDVRATDVVVQPGEASAQLHMIAQSDFVQPFAQNQLGEVRAGEVFNTINTNSNANGRNTPLVQTAMHVRRLTPVECERLQGFPDGWTDIRPGGKDTPDSPRYKALGNSMAVPVMRWIGERIAKASRG